MNDEETEDSMMGIGTSYGVNVRDHGAAGDGTTDDAPAIQALLAKGVSLLYFPPGSYVVAGPLRLPSGTRIEAHRSAHIRFGDGAGRDVNSFLLCNADMEGGNEEIAIRGGIWDGNNANNPRGEEADRQGYTGVMINFRNVRNLSLVDMTLRNSTAYHTRLCGVKDFRVERLRFEKTEHSRNQDGVHLGGHCEDGLIRDIVATGRTCTGDDLVALNGDDALDRTETRGKLGGPIRRVRVERLRADDCHSFVRMASVWSTIEDVEVHDVRGGCRVNVLNADALRFCMGPLFRRDDDRYAGGVGLLRNVRLRDIAAYKTQENDMPLLRLDERMEDFEVENLVRLRRDDAAPQAPTVRISFVKSNSVSLEGITEADARACAETSTCTDCRIQELPGMGRRTRRVDAGLDTGGAFTCDCDAFDRLRVAQTQIDPLPEPDWMVAKGQYC
jgi:hypothetical protein